MSRIRCSHPPHTGHIYLPILIQRRPAASRVCWTSCTAYIQYQHHHMGFDDTRRPRKARCLFEDSVPCRSSPRPPCRSSARWLLQTLVNRIEKYSTYICPMFAFSPTKRVLSYHSARLGWSNTVSTKSSRSMPKRDSADLIVIYIPEEADALPATAQPAAEWNI